MKIVFHHAKYFRGEQELHAGLYLIPPRNVCLWTGEGKLTVNVAGQVLASDEVAIKTWSENEGVEKDLLLAGVIEGPVLRRIPSGFVEIPIYKRGKNFPQVE